VTPAELNYASCFLLGLVVLAVMAAFPGVVAVISQLREFVVEGLDGSFLLAENFLDQLEAVGFEGLVATATTFCCVGPAVIAIIGTGGVVAAARLAPYRGYWWFHQPAANA
jgi:hypothetical protein